MKEKILFAALATALSASAFAAGSNDTMTTQNAADPAQSTVQTDQTMNTTDPAQTDMQTDQSLNTGTETMSGSVAGVDFEQLDANSDGRLSEDELEGAETGDNSLADADSDDDGYITRAEFARFEMENEGSATGTQDSMSQDSMDSGSTDTGNMNSQPSTDSSATDDQGTTAPMN